MKVVNESYVGFVATNAIFIREGTDYSRQRPAGAKQLHLHSRDGFALEVRDLRNRVVMSIEEIEKGASGGRKKLQGPVEEFDLAARVEIGFEIGRSGNQAFVDGLDVLGRTSPTPVIPNGVINNFHEKRARAAGTGSLARLPTPPWRSGVLPERRARLSAVQRRTVFLCGTQPFGCRWIRQPVSWMGIFPVRARRRFFAAGVHLL